MTMNSNYFGQLPSNLERTCRVCLSESTNLSSIFCTDPGADDFPGIYKKIQVCGSIEIQEEDGLPSMICDGCLYKATVAHEFRQQCQHSDARLRSHYNKPAKSNLTDSETQTEPQTRIISKRKASTPEEHYFVKVEMQPAITQEFQNPVETFTEPETLAEDNKIFVCNMGFEGSKDDEEEGTETLKESNTHNSQFPQSADLSTGSVDLVPMEETEGEQLQEEEKESESRNEDIQSEEEGEEEQEEEEGKLRTTKRSYNRKAKSLPQSKTYSDDDMNDDYYEQSSDSEGSKVMKFKCKVCTKRYATQKGLKKHSLVHDKKHKCNICFKMFYKLENMEKHKKIHASKPHACQLCHASFSKAQSLVRHLRSHTEKVNNMIKQINNDDANDDKSNRKEFKNEVDTDDENNGALNETDDFENAPELYKCQECNQYCSSLKNLKRHSLIHGDKKYSCTVCKKWFFRPDTLKKHAEKHGHGLLDNLIEDNNLFDSDDNSVQNQTEDSAAINNSESLKKDGSGDEDGGEAEYKCQHCDKVMATKKGLRRHVSMHKPKAEPATCDICEKVCASQARLALHQKTHNKPKEKVPREYLCHICSKVYPSNSSLTYHMRTHTGVKPHVCKICNSGFTTTTSLANHLRIHTGDKPFVCHVCSAAFAVSSAFRRHLTRHTGEANYLCKTCGKAFKRLSTLKEHTYTHSGEKPYICKTCGAAYSHSGSLFAHQKRCKAQYGEIGLVEEHHHAVAHHIHVNNVQSAVRSLAVIGQMF